jgi:ArsR family transcriptional regulator
MEIMKKAKMKYYKTARIDKEKISSVRKKMKSDRTMQEIVKIFEVIGGPTKADIISALCFDEMCASEIAAVIGTTRSNVAHQVKTLIELGLVKSRRKGRYVFYSLDAKGIKWVFDEFLKRIRR